MELWRQWWGHVCEFRMACSRERTFCWLIVALIGFSTRLDLLGVSSFVRALGLKGTCYHCLLDFFHTSGLDTGQLTSRWLEIVFSRCSGIMTSQGRPILVADGIKVAKSGRKMPAVKKLHQESESNTKPEYIMGHSCQAIGVLAQGMNAVFAIPLAARIHEGIKTTNRDKRTLLDKLILLLDSLTVGSPVLLVVDAYYASRKIALPLLERGHHLITRVKTNAVAFEPAPPPKKGQRGRPRKYGTKIKLSSLFDDEREMEEMQSPLQGEKNVVVLIRSRDLIWRPVGIMVRFVAVIHPIKGKRLLMTTDLTLAPLEVARLYGLRFKIEVAFKQALHVVGSFLYHFWMAPMKPLKRYAGTQHLHRESKQYRKAVERKMDAYHRYIQIGIIAQGLMQLLACNSPKLVWTSFGSWLRTMRPDTAPSERVVSIALRNTLVEFLADRTCGANFKKFIWDRIDLKRADGLRLAS